MTRKSFLGLITLFAVGFVGCHELGHVDGPANTGGVGSNLAGEVQYVDTRTSEIEIRSDSGRSSYLRYDANTRVVFQNRNYAVSNLEPGDVVNARVYQERDGRLYTDSITVQNSVQNRRYSGAIGSFRGTVSRNDPRYSSMNLDLGEGRTRSFYYNAQTRVTYRNRDYPVANITSGDIITVRTRDNNQQTPTADTIVVNSTSQDRAVQSSINKLESVDGRVEFVDTSRGMFEIRGPSNRLIVVNLQFNPPRAVIDRFNRLRNGDTVRLEGRYLNQDRFELENFL